MEKRDGKYYLGGADLLALAEKYDLPLYVYDAEKIEEKYRRFKSAFSYPKVKIKYAIKALSNLSVLKFIKKLGAGADAVSIQEVWTALKAGFAPEDILFTPNCVSFEEIKLAVSAGVKINIDNLSTLERFGYEYGGDIPICLRINPHIMAGGNAKISVGHIDSKFGISIHQTPLTKRIVSNYGITVEGLHMHTGSDILDSDAFLMAADILFDLAKSFDSIKYLDFGSGFKVPYREDDVFTDIEALGEKTSERFFEFAKEYGEETEIFFEPGKFLVSEAGVFLVRTNVVKQTTSTIFAGVDSGFNHLIRPMFYDAYHKIVNVSNPDAIPKIYSVVGYICETDTFGYNRKIAEIKEGDVLAICNAGAYCFSMSSNYNSRFRPAEVMVLNGEDYLIRKRETFEDLLANQIEIDL